MTAKGRIKGGLAVGVLWAFVGCVFMWPVLMLGVLAIGSSLVAGLTLSWLLYQSFAD